MEDCAIRILVLSGTFSFGITLVHTLALARCAGYIWIWKNDDGKQQSLGLIVDIYMRQIVSH